MSSDPENKPGISNVIDALLWTPAVFFISSAGFEIIKSMDEAGNQPMTLEQIIKISSSFAAAFITLGLGRLIYKDRQPRPSIAALSIGLGVGLNFMFLENHYVVGAFVAILGLAASIKLRNESNDNSSSNS